MKTFGIIAKIVAALLAVAGAVYVVATYGDKIVAWAKKMLPCKECAEAEVAEETAEVTEGGDEVVEGGEEVVEATEVAVENTEVAEESDFEEQ